MVGIISSLSEEPIPTIPTRPRAGFRAAAWSRTLPLGQGWLAGFGRLAGSGGRSDPHVSVPTFRLVSDLSGSRT